VGGTILLILAVIFLPIFCTIMHLKNRKYFKLLQHKYSYKEWHQISYLMKNEGGSLIIQFKHSEIAWYTKEQLNFPNTLEIKDNTEYFRNFLEKQPDKVCFTKLGQINDRDDDNFFKNNFPLAKISCIDTV